MSAVNWLNYSLNVYEPSGTSWHDVAGVYIFAGLTPQGWIAYYIGQADSFANRLANHERWAEAVRLGATHVHARVERLQANRDSIEKQLIQAFQPPLNVQLKSLW